MTFAQFSQSLENSAPPAEIGKPLQALWYAKNEHWEKAHLIVQELPGREAAWVHAWLHRQEGDESNAAYWYRRAEKNSVKGNLDVEWEEITRSLLSILKKI